MIQTVIVILVLVVTAIFVVKWIVRQLRGNGSGCGCGCNNCPMSGNKKCKCQQAEKTIELPEIKIDR